MFLLQLFTGIRSPCVLIFSGPFILHFGCSYSMPRTSRFKRRYARRLIHHSFVRLRFFSPSQRFEVTLAEILLHGLNEPMKIRRHAANKCFSSYEKPECSSSLNRTEQIFAIWRCSPTRNGAAMLFRIGLQFWSFFAGDVDINMPCHTKHYTTLGLQTQ
jgi:hypothetical protein